MRSPFAIYRFSCIPFFLLCLFHQAYGQNIDYLFENLTIADGLSQSTIKAIAQDPRGYIWIGTADGLNRYDGYDFKVYTNNPGDTLTISDNGVSAIFPGEKYLWIGTVAGYLNRFDYETESFKRFKIIEAVDSLVLSVDRFQRYPITFTRNHTYTITSIEQDDFGRLWVGTWGAGIALFDIAENNSISLTHNPYDSLSIASNSISDIYKDGNGTIWIGYLGSGLDKMIYRLKDEPNPDKPLFKDQFYFIHYQHNRGRDASLSNDFVTSICSDTKGNLWIGTFGGGLCMLPAEQIKRVPQFSNFRSYRNVPGNKRSLSSDAVLDIIESDDNKLWVATFGGGLNRFDFKSESFTWFTYDPVESNSIIDNDVICLFEDRSGIIWAGTHLGKGISKIVKHSTKFKLLQSSPIPGNGLNDNVVWSVCDDDSNNIWVGTYKGGLNRYNRNDNSFSYFTANTGNTKGLISNHIRAIVEDPWGDLWIGTYSGGLYHFDKETYTFRRFANDPDDDNSISSNQIQTIYIDSDTTFWVGTFGAGLNYFQFDGSNFDDITFSKFKHDPNDPASISDNRVYSILEDHNGIIWVGTLGGGLNRLNKERTGFNRFLKNPLSTSSLQDNRVLIVFQDSWKRIWVGTFGGGLQQFNPETGSFTLYDEEEGFNSHVVYGILEDNNENLWISSDNGIVKYDMRNEIFVHYNLQDGLQSLEFSGGAYHKNKRGEMFFGGINGVNFFYPDSVSDNLYIPPVVVTSVKLFGNEIRGDVEKLNLSYDENFLTFSFAALDYTSPNENNYAYYLEGIESEWHLASSDRRTVSYANLSPGEYIFHVKGSNNDGVWNQTGTTVAITILAPFYKTWWFISLVVIIIGLSISLFIGIRIRNLVEMDKLKSKLAADLHDNVGAGLTEISILSELVVKDLTDDESAARRLNTISQTARELIDNMSDIVWIVNPNRDSLHDLLLRIKDSYSEVLSSLGVSFKISNFEELENIRLPMQYRQNLYLIFKESINNAMKYSRCKKLLLEAEVKGNYLHIELYDNGVGADKESLKLGNGILNIKNRAETIGGKLLWKSKPGKGTSVTFIGRVRKNTLLGKIKNIFE